LFAVIAGRFEVSFTIGAFLAGLALSESFLNHEIFTEIKPLRNIFSMVFFVSIGALFNLSAIGDSIPVLLVILLILLPIKVITIAGINLWFGVHIKNALRIGLGIMQIGEFAFLASQIGLSSGWIDESLYSVIIAATVISLALTPLLYANLEWFYGLSERYARKISPNLYRGLFLSQLEDDLRTTSKPDGHIILCGYGQVGQYVAAALEASQVPFTIIELDAAAVETAAAKKYTAIFGDASNPDILKQAHIATAKAIVISIPSVEDTKKVINEAKQLNPEAKIIVRTRKGLNGTDATGMIDHAIEPEFEVAIQIITQLYKIIHRRNKRVLDLVKALRSEGAA
jgi:CPA2 family monovalent cation:H+ antiporter-2